MLISKFSKDGKRGFAVGSNSLTPEKLAAGAITLASGILMAGIGGLLKVKKKPSRAGAASKERKKTIWLLLLPMIFKSAKSVLQKKSLDALISGLIAENTAADVIEKDGIEVIDAIPISSEAEIYDHI